jgi:hypothetical protein
MCEPPSNPTANLSPAALFAPTIGPAQFLLTARESHVLHLLACAGMAVNTHGVHLEQAELLLGATNSCARGPISVGWCWPAPSRFFLIYNIIDSRSTVSLKRPTVRPHTFEDGPDHGPDSGASQVHLEAASTRPVAALAALQHVLQVWHAAQAITN